MITTMTPDTCLQEQQQSQHSTLLVGCSLTLFLFFVYLAYNTWYRWNKDVKHHLDNLRKKQEQGDGNLPFTRMIRNRNVGESSSSTSSKLGQELNLRPGYVAINKGGVGKDESLTTIGLTSLSNYFSSIRPADSPTSTSSSSSTPSLLREEVDALITKTIIQSLGAKFGSLLLPLLSAIPKMRMDILGLTSMSEISSKGSSALVSGLGATSLLELGAIADIVGLAVSIAQKKKDHQRQREETKNKTREEEIKTNKDTDENDKKDKSESEAKKKVTTTATEKMKNGEAASTFSSTLVPNPFLLHRDFPQAIQHKLDEQSKDSKNKGDDDFDPDSYPVDVPRPVNERLLPDLHFGYGGALGTHTHREMLQNRLLAILLNRLGANDLEEGIDCANDEKNTDEQFEVHVEIDQKLIIIKHPNELVSALADLGYNVSVTPKLNITSFGLGLCVKEDDDGKRWSNIPVGVVLKSGYENENGQMALVVLPHGGLVLEVTSNGKDRKGQLVIKGRCTTQHFVAIDGFCGWFPHHNVQVPWKIDDAIDSFPSFLTHQKKDIEQAIRLAGFSAIVLNGAASRLKLPRGGYGLVGTCNDSLALVEMAMWGKTNVYPLLSLGKYHTHLVREARRCVSRFEEEKRDSLMIKDMKSILKALLNMPNDLVATPRHSGDAVRRMLHCMPPSMPFAFMEETKEVLETVQSEDKAFTECSQ